MARKPIYDLDVNYFNKIITRSQAYILGFIYADGSVSKWGRLYLNISEKDIEILEFIKKELKTNIPIKTLIAKNNKKYSFLSIARKKLCLDLINLGIVPNKTYESKKFPNVPNNLYNSFLLGFFDGDGGLTISNNEALLSFSNNIYVLKSLQEFFIKTFNIKGYLRTRRKNNPYTGMLEIKGSLQIERILDFLYSNPPFCLSRKMEKYQIVKNSAQKYKNKTWKLNGNNNLVISLYNAGTRQFEIAKKTNLIYGSVRGCIQRARKLGLCK